MKAMVINRIVSLLEDEAPLTLVELPDPEPVKGEVRVRVSACGVCQTSIVISWTATTIRDCAR